MQKLEPEWNRFTASTRPVFIQTLCNFFIVVVNVGLFHKTAVYLRRELHPPFFYPTGKGQMMLFAVQTEKMYAIDK